MTLIFLKTRLNDFYLGILLINIMNLMHVHRGELNPSFLNFALSLEGMDWVSNRYHNLYNIL